MNVLDLFSGIGGFSLGLERAGMRTVAFCEQDEFCRAVLAQHWPSVPIYDDVRTLTADTLRRDGIAVDAICGGFPCQDLSFAGRRAGLEGARSGLWSEYARLIGELRPRFVVVENVPGLLSLGMGAVLGDLAALGYDAVWDCVPASAVGAPHRRDRVWIVAHANGYRRSRVQPQPRPECGDTAKSGNDGKAWSVAHATGHRPAEHPKPRPYDREEGREGEVKCCGGGQAVADAYGDEQHRRGSSLQMGRQRSPRQAQDDGYTFRAEWLTEPDVGRVADGVPARVDRLRSLGNAVVPQIPYLIGRAIMQAESP